MIEREQALIARVLDALAQRFGNRAVLRGGMVLWILGSPRFTNDLDYLFVPYKSKKDIVSDADRFRANTAAAFYEFLRQYATRLTDDEIWNELSDYLPSDEIEGLAMEIRSALVKLH